MQLKKNYEKIIRHKYPKSSSYDTLDLVWNIPIVHRNEINTRIAIGQSINRFSMLRIKKSAFDFPSYNR